MTGMNFNYHLLNYKLCNETSMSNKSKNYKIDIKLNQLFCIDKDDIPFGGSWADNYINYMQINIYLCKDGIENISNRYVVLFNNASILEHLGSEVFKSTPSIHKYKLISI